MFSLEWQPVRVTPLGAVYSALRHVMTCPATDYSGPQIARDRVMEMAAERGVQTDRHDPYDLMVHHAHLAEVLARASRQPSQEPLTIHPGVKVGSTGLEWKPEGYLIDGGTRLMRVVLANHWDDDRQMSELHSWRTVGDVSVTGLPMQIRVLVIGSVTNGRRYGHWTRARQHPYDKSLRFQRRSGQEDGFSDSYKTVWREHAKIGPDPWIEQMSRDGVLREVAFTRNVIVPSGRQREMVLDDITRIGLEMEEAWGVRNKIQFPMTRSACDLAGPGRGPCLYQSSCYSPVEITPGESGLFKRREMGKESWRESCSGQG
jgi:hypothetical protein